MAAASATYDMYKLFLCLRYLRTRLLALIAVVAVALCVFMLLVAVSVMNGFLSKLEHAAKGLFGDVIVEEASMRGFGLYEEFVALLAGGGYPLVAVGLPDGPLEPGSPPSFEVPLTGAEAWAIRCLRMGEGGLQVAQGPVSVPVTGMLYRDGRFLGEVRGTGRLDELPVLRVGLEDANVPGEPTPRGEWSLEGISVQRGACVEAVGAASPFILSYGLLRVPGDPTYRRAVRLAGVPLPERADVSDFEDSLFVQHGRSEPVWDPPWTLIQDRLQGEIAAASERIESLESRLEELGGRPGPGSSPTPRQAELMEDIRRLGGSRSHMRLALRSDPNRIETYQQRIEAVQRRLQEARRRARGAETREVYALMDRLDELCELAGLQPPDQRAIVGLRIPGLSFRTADGRAWRFLAPGSEIVVTVFPVGGAISHTDLDLPRRLLTVVDDSHTGVYQIDSEFVYLPLELLQQLNNMTAIRSQADPNRIVEPARVSSIHVKVRPSHAGSEQQLRQVAQRIEALWSAFRERNPELLFSSEVNVATWRQRQARIIAPIESQRTLVAIMFGIMSLVAVVLIFAVFYIIVDRKRRDIGVLKAIGASGGGVASIFLAYGAAIGLVGSGVGVILAAEFIRRINAVHDWFRQQLGFEVWSMETFLFDRIPNQTDWQAAVWIVLGSAAAGIVGALLPALQASLVQPVESLRYE